MIRRIIRSTYAFHKSISVHKCPRLGRLFCSSIRDYKIRDYDHISDGSPV